MSLVFPYVVVVFLQRSLPQICLRNCRLSCEMKRYKQFILLFLPSANERGVTSLFFRHTLCRVFFQPLHKVYLQDPVTLHFVLRMAERRAFTICYYLASSHPSNHFQAFFHDLFTDESPHIVCSPHGMPYVLDLYSHLGAHSSDDPFYYR